MSRAKSKPQVNWFPMAQSLYHTIWSLSALPGKSMQDPGVCVGVGAAKTLQQGVETTPNPPRKWLRSAAQICPPTEAFLPAAFTATYRALIGSSSAETRAGTQMASPGFQRAAQFWEKGETTPRRTCGGGGPTVATVNRVEAHHADRPQREPGSPLATCSTSEGWAASSQTALRLHEDLPSCCTPSGAQQR